MLSNLSISQNHAESLWKCRFPCPISKVSDLVFLWWGLIICIFNKLPGDTDGVEQRPQFENPWIRVKLLTVTNKNWSKVTNTKQRAENTAEKKQTSKNELLLWNLRNLKLLDSQVPRFWTLSYLGHLLYLPVSVVSNLVWHYSIFQIYP